MKVLLIICIVFNVAAGAWNYILQSYALCAFNTFAAGVCAAALYVNILKSK